MVPSVIPIFIPHQGCPHQCLFCNQRVITGEKSIETSSEFCHSIPGIIEKWLGRLRGGRVVQVAFYGGSFTCLERNQQLGMLDAVHPYLDSGHVQAIRLSTRPDCMCRDQADFLIKRGVRIVELGVQSLDDSVLLKAERGHNADDSRRAAGVLNDAGLEVGIQLMPGLPGETTRSFLRTVAETIKLSPSLVRVYPALVVSHSGLAKLYQKGSYLPLSLNRAVALSVIARQRFVAAGISVARIGLQPSASLEKDLLAGPYHPAFGELVASRIWFKRFRRLLTTVKPGQTISVKVSHRDLSAIIGLKRCNMIRLEELGLVKRLNLLTSKEIARGDIRVDVG